MFQLDRNEDKNIRKGNNGKRAVSFRNGRGPAGAGNSMGDNLNFAQTLPMGLFRCKGCGRSFAIHPERHQCPDLTKLISDSNGALILGYQVSFDGLCPVCAARDNTPASKTNPRDNE